MSTRPSQLAPGVVQSVTLGLILVASLAACTEVWAQGIATEMANDLDKIESYQGRTIETGIADGQVVKREVLYQRPGKVRVETLAPEAHAGELFLYDGKRVVYWWPSLGFGVELSNAHLPSPKQIRAHIQRLTSGNLAAYAFSLRSESRALAGQRAKEWRVIPTRKGPLRMRHKVWTHATYGMPLKMVFSDSARNSWYEMSFESIDYQSPLAADAFDFEFPENAIVFRWDLDAEGISLAQAHKQMNFVVREAKKLPKGHSLQKIIKLDNALPMLSMIMDNGASKLTLTQSRFMGITPAPLGKRIKIGDADATLSFMGPFSSITWVVDDTLLTLSGNLGFPDLVAIAESVQ